MKSLIGSLIGLVLSVSVGAGQFSRRPVGAQRVGVRARNH